jgi:hypothetical protein
VVEGEWLCLSVGSHLLTAMAVAMRSLPFTEAQWLCLSASLQFAQAQWLGLSACFPLPAEVQWLGLCASLRSSKTLITTKCLNSMCVTHGDVGD